MLVNLVDYFAVELAEIPRTMGRVASILNEPRQQLISAETNKPRQRGRCTWYCGGSRAARGVGVILLLIETCMAGMNNAFNAAMYAT